MFRTILFAGALIACLSLGFCAGVMSSDQNKEGKYVVLDIPIKKLLAEPMEGAKTVYDVPIGMRLTGRTADKKWYKARISYNFIGYFEYEGWVKAE